MRDDINIRELYNQILEERAAANGVIIKENLNMPFKGSPDKVTFDGVDYNYDNNANPFSFIGDGSGLVGYINDEDGTHPYIFNAFRKLAAALGVAEWPATMSYMKSKYSGAKLKDAAKILKSDGVSHFGEINPEQLKYFDENQVDGTLSTMRKNTRSGRIWFDVKSDKVGDTTNIIVFWCRQKDVRMEDLEALKTNFKLSNFFWGATDSSEFNYYNDDYREGSEGKIKELKSKIYPNLSHDDIVDILMRAHTGYKITPFEQKVVWEFRGFDPEDIKQVTGGYPTRAEFVNRSKFSESFEDFKN